MAEPHPLRSTRTMVATAFLLVVMLGGVVVALSFRGEDEAQGTGPTTPPSGAAQPAAGACRPSHTDQAIPQEAPAGVRWELFYNIALPSSPTAGPLQIRDGVARCYARTPVGALIAVQQIGVRAGFGPAWESIVAEQFMPGPGRDAYARSRAAFVPDRQPGAYSQTAGFKFISYSQQSAVVQIVDRATDGGLWATTWTVVWSEGTWKLQATPDGKASSEAQALTSLDGFVAWGGV